MTAREHLYELVEALPDSELEPAARFLEFLTYRLDDPVLRALERASIDDEPLTDEDAQALEEAFADRDHGRVFSHEEVRRSLLETSSVPYILFGMLDTRMLVIVRCRPSTALSGGELMIFPARNWSDKCRVMVRAEHTGCAL